MFLIYEEEGAFSPLSKKEKSIRLYTVPPERCCPAAVSPLGGAFWHLWLQAHVHTPTTLDAKILACPLSLRKQLSQDQSLNRGAGSRIESPRAMDRQEKWWCKESSEVRSGTGHSCTNIGEPGKCVTGWLCPWQVYVGGSSWLLSKHAQWWGGVQFTQWAVCSQISEYMSRLQWQSLGVVLL